MNLRKAGLTIPMGSPAFCRRTLPGWRTSHVLIRKETAADRPAILNLVAAAFERRDRPDEKPVEVELQRRLMESAAYIPELSLVAEDGGRIMGAVITTRAWVEDQPVLGLGPISVSPDRQGRGFGTELINATIAAAEKLGESTIVLLGSTEYYPRFGFVPASRWGIAAPETAWGDHFQALPLRSHSSRIRGKFRYAAPFDDV